MYLAIERSVVLTILLGSVVGDPDTYGLTLAEEKLACGISDWPNFSLDFQFQNADLKLYGGAQYERLLNEFEFVAHSIGTFTLAFFLYKG